MDNYKLIERLGRIVGYLRDQPGISKNLILEKLAENEQETITLRTLERDFKSLRERFFLEIIYDRSRNGYSLDADFDKEVNELLHFTELCQLGSILNTGFNDFKAFSALVQLDQSSAFQGIELIKPTLLAIQQRQKIHFTHINYWEETQKSYTITPLMIKEYLKRWYVIGVPEGKNEIRTFGMDRVKTLEIGNPSSIKHRDFTAQLDQFHKIVGLNFNDGDGKIKEIKLRVHANHIKYLSGLPLHHSQRIDYTTGEPHGTVTYQVIINYEFKVEILKMGNLAEVISPPKLRDAIKKMLEETLELYFNTA